MSKLYINSSLLIISHNHCITSSILPSYTLPQFPHHYTISLSQYFLLLQDLHYITLHHSYITIHHITSLLHHITSHYITLTSHYITLHYITSLLHHNTSLLHHNTSLLHHITSLLHHITSLLRHAPSTITFPVPLHHSQSLPATSTPSVASSPAVWQPWLLP